MTSNVTVEKLSVIKELAAEKSVQQLCDVLIEYIKSEKKGELGFKAPKDES